MDSPPDSILRRTNDSDNCLDAPVKSPKAQSERPVRLSSISSSEELVDALTTPAMRRLGPPSPASSTSALAVGSSTEAALIQSIEHGDYAPDGFEDTRSLTDSIRQHIVDGSLRYHAYHAGKYQFPNDEAEQDREELKHNLTIYLSDGEYFFAPIKKLLEQGAEVLDLGTGIGKWCIDREYTGCEMQTSSGR